MSATPFRSIAGEQINEKPLRFELIPFENIRLTRKSAYLVKGLIPRCGLIVAWGPPKCAKSFWALDLAMHISLGRKYRGRRVTQGAVVYCAFEGADGFRKRVEAFRMSHLAEETDPVPFYLLATRVDLIADYPELIACIRTQTDGQAMVVLDTLNRSLTGSESKDEDMAAYLKAADAIREAFGCAVMIVHHCGIDDKRPRGHTSLTGAADAQLAVKREKATGICTVEVEWMKDGPEGDAIAFRLDRIEVGRDEDGDEIDSCVVVPVDEQAQLVKQPDTKRLTKAAQIALRALREALADVGEPAPPSNQMPSNVTVVQIATWRRYAYERGISTGEQRAKEKAFERATETLIAAKLVATWDGYAWTC